MDLLKNISLVALLIAVIFSNSLFADAKGQHIKDAKITLKFANGKTFTTTTDANGKFTFHDIDCDGEFTMSVSNDVLSWSWGVSNSGTIKSKNDNSAGKSSSGGGSGKVNMQDISMTKRDAASGQATGKRSYEPFKAKYTLCPKGNKDNDCDGRACILDVSFDGNTLQGMAINEKPIVPKDNSSNKGNK